MSGNGLGFVQVAILQVAVAILATGVGGGAGWYLGRDAGRKEQEAALGMTVPDALAKIQGLQDQYQALVDRCEPLEGSERDRLIEAQEKVEDLRGQIEKKEEELKVLEKKAKQNVALKKELEQKKAELAELQVALDNAEKERVELVEKLQTAYTEVSVARAQTKAAKQEVIEVKWDEFKARALVDICEKGTKGKMEKCREAVEAALTPDREARYRECARKKAAVPQLRRKTKDEKELPAFGEWMGQGSKFMKNEWYILFCDPTLPEAGDGEVVLTPPVGATGADQDLERDIEALEKEDLDEEK